MFIERLLGKKIELWVVGLLLVLIFCFGIFAAGVLRDEIETRAKPGMVPDNGAFGRAVVRISTLKSDIETVFNTRPPTGANEAPHVEHLPSGWSSGEPTPPISGYLLLSRVDGDAQRSVAEFLDLRTFEILHRWEVDPTVLLADVERNSRIVPYTQWNNLYFRAKHPLLEADGTLVVHGQFSPLMRLGPCGDRRWIYKGHNFHHSLMKDHAGNFWAPSLTEPSPNSASKRFRDDTLTAVDADGKMVFSKSLTTILREHGHDYLFYQMFGYSQDPLHLNDIEPVMEDGPYWKKGDLFLSMRRKSMIMLYRPATDEIIWMKRGPWWSQHDVDIVDDTRIAIFNNNVRETGRGRTNDGTANVLIYDFATDSVSSPYQETLEELVVDAESNGLYDFTKSGHIIIEDDLAGRLIILGPEGEVAHQYLNRAEDGIRYRMSWTRYVPQALGDAARAALEAAPACD